MTEPTRRTWLRLCAATSLATVAGCSESDAEGDIEFDGSDDTDDSRRSDDADSEDGEDEREADGDDREEEGESESDEERDGGDGDDGGDREDGGSDGGDGGDGGTDEQDDGDEGMDDEDGGGDGGDDEATDGDEDDETAPSASFEFEVRESGDLEIVHTAGDEIDPERLVVTGAVAEEFAWVDLDDSGATDPIAPGDSVTVPESALDGGDVALEWERSDGTERVQLFETTVEVASGGTVRIALRYEPTDEFDPIVVLDATWRTLARLVFDPPYAVDRSFDLVPILAVDEPEVARSGARYVVELRDDARFHDGTLVRSSDLAYSLEAPIDEETGVNPVLDRIDSVQRIDDLTLQIDLESPFAPFPREVLTEPVVSESARENDPSAYARSPVGSGPFRFESGDDEVVLERADGDWRDSRPAVDRLEFEAIQDSSTRLAALEDGYVDLVRQPDLSSWDRLDRTSGLAVDAIPGAMYNYIAFNCADGPTADPAVRRGIAAAVPIAEIVEDHFGDDAYQAWSPIPRPIASGWGFRTDRWEDALPPYDPDAAQDLLEENVGERWEPRFIAPPNDELRVRTLEELAAAVESLDVEIYPEVEVLDWRAFLDRYTSGDADEYAAYALGWRSGYDPDSVLYNLFHESNAGVLQGHYYDDPDVIGAIDAARETPDRTERRRNYEDAVEPLLRDVVHLPTHWAPVSYAYDDAIDGFDPHPSANVLPLRDPHGTIRYG